MSFLSKYKYYLISLMVLTMVAYSAWFITSYEEGQLEKCKKEGKATIIEAYESNNTDWFFEYEYKVGRSDFKANVTIQKPKGMNYFYLGNTIDIYYGCINPRISKVKRLVEENLNGNAQQ